MEKIFLPAGAQLILEKLHRQGEKAYVVGGCVRDSLMGSDPHDWDICTSAQPGQVKEILKGYRVLDTGLRHGTVTVLDENGEPYEVTTFRTEAGYTDGRHPDSVQFVRSISEDLSRRDFTMNAMAYNDQEGVVDPFGGREDLQKGLIRCVGAPDTRFSEDALRILRAVRFSAQFGFCIEPSTAAAMCRQKGRLEHVSDERIGAEFKKIVCAPYAADAIGAGREIICEIIPELTPLIECGQNSKYHYEDVFCHTLSALKNAESCERFPKAWADDLMRIALFFHDFGKPSVKTTGEDGFDHFYAHGPASAKIAETVMRRLKFSNAEIETVTQLVAHHDMVFAPNRACARRMLNKFGYDQLKRLLKLHECDSRAHTPLAHREFEEKTVPFAARVGEVLEEQSAFALKDLAIDGRDILALGVKPGPLVGQLLAGALNAVLEETVENRKEPLLQLIQRMLEI